MAPSSPTPPVDEEAGVALGDCRICLESGPISNGAPRRNDRSSVIAPCKCTGTCAYVHPHCLETWVLEKGSARCEVCKSAYSEAALTERAQQRLAWPEYPGLRLDDVMQVQRVQARRLLLISSVSLLTLLLLLGQGGVVEGEGRWIRGGASPILSDSLARSYMDELGLGAAGMAAPAPPDPPPSSFTEPAFADAADAADGAGSAHAPWRAVVHDGTFGGEDLGFRGDELGPGPGGNGDYLYAGDGGGGLGPSPPSAGVAMQQPAASAAAEGGALRTDGEDEMGVGVGGPLPPLAPAYAPSPPSPLELAPTSALGLVQEMMGREGCMRTARSQMGERCEHAHLLLRHFLALSTPGQAPEAEAEADALSAAAREKEAEKQAGEAMARMTRAFILLCLLRILIAHHTRRRTVQERVAAVQERAVAVREGGVWRVWE